MLLSSAERLAAELQGNCQKLAIFLKNTFRIAKQVNEVDFEAARKEDHESDG